MEAKLQNDIFQWDVKSWSCVLPLWQSWIDKNKPQKALTIGEREGGLTLWLALQKMEVCCTDLNGFEDVTQEMHIRYGVQEYISYEAQDVTALNISDNSFDLVVFKSVIGALSEKERQQKAINEIHRVLKPGGALLFAENMKSTKVHAWLRKRFIRWEHYWRYLHFRTDQDLFSKFSSTDLKSYGLFAAFGRSQTQRNVLALLDKAICPITPSTWHYILYGVCIK